MKKFLFLIALLLTAAVSTQAQALGTRMYNPSNRTSTPDTLATGTMYFSVANPTSGTLAVQLNVKKVSGTPAGAVTLEASLDGTNYVAIKSNTADTLINGDKGFLFSVPADYAAYRVKLVQSASTTKVAPVALWMIKRE